MVKITYRMLQRISALNLLKLLGENTGLVTVDGKSTFIIRSKRCHTKIRKRRGKQPG